MRSRIFLTFGVIILLVAISTVLIFLSRQSKPERIEQNQVPVSNTMRIQSTDFENNQTIPKKYSCDGDGINPSLTFSDVPKDAQSLTLIVDDPDAPSGTFTHWTLWNIDSKSSGISENSVPSGAIQGNSDAGKIGYVGPCPPSGTHRYFFKLFALDSKIDLPSGSKRSDLEKMIENHIIARSELIGLYSREK